MDSPQSVERRLPLFRNLNPDDPEPETTNIESLCLNCGENGVTRLLLTKIPFYKEVVLMSFCCEHCGFQNNEVQSGGEIEEKGIRITLQIKTSKDLNRQVIKSDYTSTLIPELQFEMPSQSQKGEVTTVEGLISRAISGLRQDQEARGKVDPEAALQIDDFLKRLEKLKAVDTPFTMIFEDISGNTHVENPALPQTDSNCHTHRFKRTHEQDHTLGIYSRSEVNVANATERGPDGILTPAADFKLHDLEGEVLKFATDCPSCSTPCQTNMKMTNIPHFKDVVIMATTCEVCGHRSNEVKSGGGIEAQGLRIEVTVTSPEDLTRDVLKSETCELSVPELKVEVGSAALGGRFTTVEGILCAMRDQLSQQAAIFSDSADAQTGPRMRSFLNKLDNIICSRMPATLILDDPAGNSYVQSMTAPTPDPKLKITHYDRSFEQNEDLGINDMNTENYNSGMNEN